MTDQAWASDILDRASPGAWTIPKTYSMKQALEQLWINDMTVEKWWIAGQNAYRRRKEAPK